MIVVEDKNSTVANPSLYSSHEHDPVSSTENYTKGKWNLLAIIVYHSFLQHPR